MNISLTPELAQFVKQRIEDGDYQTPSDVVKEGLALLKQRNDDDQQREATLRQKLAISLAESERGETVPFDESTLDEIKAEGRKRLQALRNRRN